MLKTCMDTANDGIIINPWGQTFMLTKELITLILNADKPQNHIYFDLGDINVTARVDPSTTARTDSEVYMAINMDHIHVFDKDTEEAVFNY